MKLPWTKSVYLTLTALLTLLLSGGCAGLSPYSGWESREIKALSVKDIEGLRNGRGMSLALAAELNGYPGPLHVLELADRLKLSESQRLETRALFDRMKASAVDAGETLIIAERDLDRLFASKLATPEQLTLALERVAQAQAKVRASHLTAHLEQVRILTLEQIREYNKLRGYAA